MTNLTKCEHLAVWEENGKVRLDKAPLFLIFPTRISKDGDGDDVQVRLLVEKGCDSEEKAGGAGGGEESGEQLKEVLINEFG